MDDIVRFANTNSPQEHEGVCPVYAASKTIAEKGACEFVREQEASFMLYAVLPDINIGASLDFANQGHPSTSCLVAERAVQGESRVTSPD